MVVYQVAYIFLLPWGTSHHTILHLGFALVLVSLPRLLEGKRHRRVLSLIVLVMALASIPFFFIMSDHLDIKFGLGLTSLEFSMAVVIIATTIMAAYLAWGITIPAVCVLFLAYFFFGHALPDPFQAAQMPSYDYAMTFLAAGGASGIFAGVTSISAQFIFLFILYGAVLSATGVISMFIEVGKFLGQVVKGGAAFTAIVGSSLLGTVTGATVANVALTGAVTIPSMKSQGYSPEDAVAIESAASCGGQLLPPIMGAGAILMASFLNVPYFTVVKMAVIPALLYYLILVISILIMARNRPIVVDDEPIDWRLIAKHLPTFAISLSLIIFLLADGRSPQTAIIWGLIASIVLHFLRPKNLFSILELRNRVLELYRGLIDGARQAAEIAVVLAAIAIVAQTLITTALAPKLTIMMRFLAGDFTIGWLLVSMAACIILGFGMPTAAAYTIVAILLVPAMREIGIAAEAVHFFLFYFAVYAAVTPPIATAIIVGSKIAGASFWRAAAASMRLMIIPLLLPYFFIYHPSILQFPNVSIDLLLSVVAVLLAAFCTVVVSERVFIRRTNAAEIVLSAMALSGVIIWVLTDAIIALVASLGLAATMVLLHLRRGTANEVGSPTTATNQGQSGRVN